MSRHKHGKPLLPAVKLGKVAARRLRMVGAFALLVLLAFVALIEYRVGTAALHTPTIERTDFSRVCIGASLLAALGVWLVVKFCNVVNTLGARPTK